MLVMLPQGKQSKVQVQPKGKFQIRMGEWINEWMYELILYFKQNKIKHNKQNKVKQTADMFWLKKCTLLPLLTTHQSFN